MGIGLSIFLLAVGAILVFAVELAVEGIDLNAVGVILMLFGLVGLLASFILGDDWEFTRRRRRYPGEDSELVERRSAGTRRD